jgi:hypothetical protein
MTASVPRERNDGSPGRPQVLPLLNAAARVVAVVEERTAPDAEPTGVFRVGFALQHGVPFTVDVRAEDFDAFGWLTPATRGRVFIPSDDRKARGFARVAIIATAGNAERVQRRAFLGWERAPTSPAGWMFAHAGGALGAGGPVEGFDVRPPDALARYRLPAPPDGDALRAAALAVLDFAEAGGAAGARVILPCLGATLRAALGPVDKGVTVYLAAPPGVGKSYLASLCQRFYGAGFGADAPPVSFLDKRATDAGAALLLAAAGDVLVWCDDAKDTGVELASRVVHMHFNRAVDAKGRRDGSLRVVQRPRATVLLVTGELAPRGHSVRQRAVMIDMPDRPGDLSRFDALASAGVFAEATSAIITWHLRTLAGDARGDLDMMRRTDRDAAKAWALDGTGREGELFGPLANGLVTLATWLEEILPEQGARIEALRTRSREALSQVFGEQSAHVAEEAPAVRVVELLASAIAAGSAHVAWRATDGRLTSPPAEPTTWGWRPSSDGLRGEGERVGVILPAMGGAVALNAATALRVAARMARDLSHPLPMDTTRLGAALYRAGLLAFAEERATGRRIAVDPTALPPVGGVNPGCRVRGVEGGQQRLLLLRPEALGMGFDLDVGRVEEL